MSYTIERTQADIAETTAELLEAYRNDDTARIEHLSTLQCRQQETLQLLLIEQKRSSVGDWVWVGCATAAPDRLAAGEISPLEYRMNLMSPAVARTAYNDSLGGTVFLRKPLSLDTSAVTNRQMLVNMEDLPFCPELGGDNHIGTLPLDEVSYYPHFARYSLDGITEMSLKPGGGQTSQTLYPGAFGKNSCVTLANDCTPEFAFRAKAPARAAAAGVLKSIDALAMKEQIVHATIGMSDSYFSSEQYPDDLVFYRSPPIACSTLGVGPMGMLFAVEWIGVVFYSVFSQPFFGGSANHRAALAMFDEVESVRAVDAADPLLVPKTHVLKGNRIQKRGSAWGELDGNFIKIIEAPFMLNYHDLLRIREPSAMYRYCSIIDEEACANSDWRSNAVFFYHLYKVMSVWRDVWAAPYAKDSLDAKCREVFVPTELLYGEFSVCLISPIVGFSDAFDAVFGFRVFMEPVVQAILWLARTWGLLYIDLKPLNVRMVREGGAVVARIVDFDDMLLLTEQPCCDNAVVCKMRGHEHVAKIFRIFGTVTQLFEEAGARAAATCQVCKMKKRTRY